jgi:signal transduction histidine kinase
VQLLVFALLAVIIATLADSRERAMQALHMRTAELEAVNEELRTFSQLVSHDIRRPLRVIDGYAHILLRDHAGVLAEAPQRYLSAISNASQQISLLVTQLLELSRIGRQPLQIEEVDVAALAREAIENLKVEWESRQVDFVVHALPQCRADRQLLAQALLNLIDNALKFTRDRSPAHIVIGSTTEGPVTSYYVADNGIGFDMQQADKLFMPFQRLHPEYPGIGIGLAIVDRIVRRHGGRVWANSAMDKGTTMYLTIGNASYG